MRSAHRVMGASTVAEYKRRVAGAQSLTSRIFEMLNCPASVACAFQHFYTGSVYDLLQ